MRYTVKQNCNSLLQKIHLTTLLNLNSISKSHFSTESL